MYTMYGRGIPNLRICVAHFPQVICFCQRALLKILYKYYLSIVILLLLL